MSLSKQQDLNVRIKVPKIFTENPRKYFDDIKNPFNTMFLKSSLKNETYLMN